MRSRENPHHDAGRSPGAAEPTLRSGSSAAAAADAEQRLTAWWVPILASLAWMVLWYLTPGLHGNGLGRLAADDDTAVLIETSAALGLLLVIFLLHPRYNRRLFARSRLAYLYVVPVVLGIALPLHYTMPLPVVVYVFWMTVSVVWQNYLTFGLLQTYLSERLPGWATVLTVAAVFYLGHAIMIPGRFAPPHIWPALGIIALGLVLAGLRARLGTLHLLIALHLSFYFIFA